MIGFGSTTAYLPLVKETRSCHVHCFPRDGDANYGADWGHDTKHYMNGWTAGDVNGNTVYSVGSWDGNACYCIEPGTPLAIGDRLVQKDESYWDNFPSEYNHTIDGDTMTLILVVFWNTAIPEPSRVRGAVRTAKMQKKLSYVIATRSWYGKPSS
jgi:hypothetical protein